MKLINDLITQLLDPNIFYSRFSFFESGREAINIKVDVSNPIQTDPAIESQGIFDGLIEEQVVHEISPGAIVST